MADSLEQMYKKRWPEKRRPLDMAYVNFIVHEFKKGKLLDVGCGFGELLSVLKEFGFMVKGTVASKYEADECMRKGLDVRKHDASKKFPYPNESFDFVISIGSLEHISDWQNALNEMHRVLKKNGRLLIETPNHSVFRKTPKYFEEKEDYDVVHIKEFDFDELVGVLNGRGFSEIKPHCKLFYYPRYYCVKFLDNFYPARRLPYLFFSAKKN